MWNKVDSAVDRVYYYLYLAQDMLISIRFRRTNSNIYCFSKKIKNFTATKTRINKQFKTTRSYAEYLYFYFLRSEYKR